MVLFMRHSPTSFDSGSTHRINGWMNTPPTAAGKSLAADQADRLTALERELGATIHPILTSDLRRASDTADVLGKALHQDPIATGVLRPWHVGIYEGRPSAEAATPLQYYLEHPDEAVPGGEPYTRFLGRFLPFVAQFFHQADPSTIPLIMTHGRNILTAKDWVDAGAQGISAPPRAVVGKASVGDAGLALAAAPHTFELLDTQARTGIS